MRIFFILSFLLFLLSTTLLSTAVADDETHDANLQRLEEIEERLNDALRSIEQKKTTEIDLLSDLNDVDRGLRQKQERVKKSNLQLARLKKDIRIQQKELSARQKEVEELQSQVQERLVALYKSEETGTLKTLFSADSASQMLEDYDFLERIVIHDRELLQNYRLRLQQRQESITRLAASKKRQQKVLVGLRNDEKDLQRAKKMKNRFLAAVRRDRSALDSVVSELRKRAARLTSLVSGLESGKATAFPDKVALFPLQKGLLPWPVKGRIKGGFGTKRHPELGTLIESHGIEIHTDPETPIKAVWHGTVAFAKRFKGYGNLLIVDHEDGYYTLYAQASRLTKKAGDKVKKGETLAVSGYDGADFIYFEIRQGRTPIDPIDWIVKR